MLTSSTTSDEPIKPTGSESLTAFFGGTFDPIHYGHLQPVIALAHRIGLHQVVLLPNNVPPHRPQPEANPRQRRRMVELAVEGNPLFTVDDRELRRQQPSYSIDTLETLRAELGNARPLAFIIGQDSLLTLHQWHRWQDILATCHLLVCARPGYRSTMETPALQQWLEAHLTQDPQDLHRQTHGLIFLADTPLVTISATEIRQRRRKNLSCDDLLPPAVLRYIDAHNLYR
ncbi:MULTISPECIES: nicotinate-nucleotide adenylyltransferase [unclassified Brenneria]|uniref:nicotinate-nucleotide adenylyltransferase n=1 Tax=unclassified Brenneria TaxID=2634434 RepID=UPI0029C2B143|nr:MULTISPECIES: nicotinate-nucleotide adenylyltransferase [unclassified Brenneria]MDX5627907.1 nicotinate-nucleotide adenylyltransferase [Brenneria sp. L3-3Z]MDX5694745.1 nicotinate-nucleotide adenylyltransferase [Brenneria sp. L4-2C]MEE3660533.1 nicotinate-nucleotide adenylyltransferase [Brenneria sp. g21c3]